MSGRILSFVVLLLLAGCAAPAVSTAGSACAGVTAAPFDPGVTISAARGLAVRYVGGAAVVTVAHPFPGGPPQTVVLTRCGQPDPVLPADLAAAPRLATPVTDLYSASSTHLPMLADLGRIDVVRGVADPSGVVNPDVRAGAAAGRIATFAGGGATDLEAVLRGRPDVLVTAGVDDPADARIAAAGIPVVPDAEWLEPTPLGRAEWIVLFGLLTGTETRAGQVFDRLEASYTATRARVAGLPPTPLVAGQFASGTFNVPSGGSYVGALLRDAGGTYPWATSPETGSLRLSLEEVLTKAGSAPVWITNGTTWTTRADAVAAAPQQGRLAALGPGGRAWTASLARGPGGAAAATPVDPLAPNDYFERGTTRPDLVLGDLAAILHPDAFAGHTFTFYRPLA